MNSEYKNAHKRRHKREKARDAAFEAACELDFLSVKREAKAMRKQHNADACFWLVWAIVIMSVTWVLFGS